jgi:hypothetical protein
MKQTTIHNKTFWVDEALLKAIEVLDACPKGAFATIHDYEAKETVSNINFQSRFSYMNWLSKKREALEDLKFEDLDIKDERLVKELNEDEQRLQFNECVEKMLGSINKTKSGERDDAHRQAADKFFIGICEGVKVKLKTIKVGDQVCLVKKDGYPVASHLQLAIVERSRTYTAIGDFKVVNSGHKVRMDKEINKALKKVKGVGIYKTISLKDNFSSLKIGGQVLS